MVAQANGTVKIHGREYKTVALRVNEFREAHPIHDGWSIRTELVQCDADQVIVKASIVNTLFNPNGDVGGEITVATGYAQERWTGKINSTSAVENCETSAIGRALAAAGLGGQEYASANEVQGAISQQSQGHTNRPPETIEERIERGKAHFDSLLENSEIVQFAQRVAASQDLKPEQAAEVLKYMHEQMEGRNQDEETVETASKIFELLAGREFEVAVA